VVEVHLYFELANELLGDILLPQQFLLYHF
jgi:hypothetical protein